MESFIKVYRSFVAWEWYQDINTKVLFLHMLLKANWKDGKLGGITVPRGSFISSINKISEETKLTNREVRTGITHLKMTGEVTSKATSKFTVFTVSNYDRYQINDKQNDKQLTSERHSNDIQTTTIEERKKERKEEGKKERITNVVEGVNENRYPSSFELFWKTYPRKKDKGGAYKKYNARLNSGFSEAQLLEAAEKYANECKSNQTEERYIKHASTFLADSTPFVDYLKKAGETDANDTRANDVEDTGGLVARAIKAGYEADNRESLF